MWPMKAQPSSLQVVTGVFTNKTAKQTLFDTREIPRMVYSNFKKKTAKTTRKKKVQQ